ncbi:hypothetical protein B9T34_17635 [Acinetobacter sp. ANC 3813]|nr:hypothetical protein B9T34_17635 [Acinetobacter sp. ANC 3813]
MFSFLWDTTIFAFIVGIIILPNIALDLPCLDQFCISAKKSAALTSLRASILSSMAELTNQHVKKSLEYSRLFS